MQVRFARHTERLDEVVRFYGEGLGLPELGRFDDHEGYSGVFFGLPGTDAHLEFTSGGRHDAPSPHPETLLVLYLGDADAVEELQRRIGLSRSLRQILTGTRHGITIADPDGFRVVLVAEPAPES